MNRMREYFIGDILRSSDDVFEHARAIMLLRFCFFLCFLFILPVTTDLILGLYKVVWVHSFALILIYSMPFFIKYQRNIDKSINFFFSFCIVISFIVFMMLNPETIEPVSICWGMFFLVLSALIQRGKSRVLFCCFILWIPILTVMLNIQLHGALTIHSIVEEGADTPPPAIIIMPIILSIYAVWVHSDTIKQAKQTITEQKQVISEKNKEMLDSIRYAKRIQNSLLPTDKYIERVLNEIKKE